MGEDWRCPELARRQTKPLRYIVAWYLPTGGGERVPTLFSLMTARELCTLAVEWLVFDSLPAEREVSGYRHRPDKGSGSQPVTTEWSLRGLPADTAHWPKVAPIFPDIAFAGNGTLSIFVEIKNFYVVGTWIFGFGEGEIRRT